MTIDHSETPNTFLLIIGAMKSGTTSLFDLLKQHPEISACRKKEPDFYTNTDNPSRDWEKYLHLWDWTLEKHKIAMEASTSYSKFPLIKKIPEKISTSPGTNFKFIYMMRDPVKRISSQVKHAMYEGWGKSLDEEFTDDLIYFSQYAMQLDNFLGFFPKENFLLITLEEFQSDPELILSKTCDFLSISNDFIFKDINEPRNAGDFYDIHPVFSSLLKNKLIRTVGDIFIKGAIRNKLRGFLSRFRQNEHSKGRSKLNETEIHNIYRRLAPDLQRLSRFYGIDVRKQWSIPDDIEL